MQPPAQKHLCAFPGDPYCPFNDTACTEYAGMLMVVVYPEPAVRETEDELIIDPFTI